MTLVLSSPVKSVAPGSAIRSVMTVWYFHNRSRLGECHIEAAWADPSGSNVNKRRAKMEKKRKKNSGKGPAKKRQRKVRNGKGKGQAGTWLRCGEPLQ